MQIAARNGSIMMLEILRQHGGSIESKGPKGDSLFHLAAYNGHLDTMKWLHTNGIDTSAVDQLGQSAVHIAAKRGEPHILLYLRDEVHADFTLLDNDNRGPGDCIPRYAEDDEVKSKFENCAKIISSAIASILKRSKKVEEMAITQLEEKVSLKLHNNESNKILLGTS